MGRARDFSQLGQFEKEQVHCGWSGSSPGEGRRGGGNGSRQDSEGHGGARGAFRAKDSVAQLAFGNDHSGACWRAETEARKGTTTHMRGHCGLDWGGT